MVRLLKLVSWLVHWATRTPRRVIGVLAIPALVAIALAAGPMRDRPATGSGDGLAAGPTASASPTRTGPRPTVLPGTTGPARPAPPPVPVFRLTQDQSAAATGYVVAAGSHDARPGADTSFLDSYERTRPYVTDALYREVTADSRRGDYEWAQWLAGKATVTVRVLRTGVPDGAPAPTAGTAYVRVVFTQTVRPTAGAGGPTVTTSALNLLVSRSADGRWLVSRLLADV
ncbi:MAG TPA: hypothetical protein VLM05_19915 [Mycobacteriales bacterium]|nr:hypothetical protein [Mycobacteriales bacterium]